MVKLNQIYNEDCLETMKRLPTGSVDLILADPPYFGIVKDSWDNQWSTEIHYLEWFEERIKEFKRILKPDGSIYCWGCFGENNLVFAKLALIFDKYFEFKNWINWRREYGFRGKTNFSYKKEELLYFVNDRKNYKFNHEDIREQATRQGAKEGDTRIPSNIWEFKWNNMSKERIKGFPSQKPLASSNRIIRASSDINDLVYVPFAGSGTDIVSCITNNRNYIASELSTEYIREIIEPRIKELV
ncbi:DNA-methyltransferase [Siminovitchia sp. 179-K 8D1 HS]|uniref:DNA-methyltransferase n=1 Tax=Siminovitchia sp. 179-K 8D1 HS TaxID=3142385 RepID=UPI0039A1314A